MPDQIRTRGENNGGEERGEEETGGDDRTVFGADCAAFDPCGLQPRLI